MIVKFCQGQLVGRYFIPHTTESLKGTFLQCDPHKNIEHNIWLFVANLIETKVAHRELQYISMT